jgi:hypothetical protein
MMARNTHVGGDENVHDILVGKSEENRPFRRAMSIWEDNI